MTTKDLEMVRFIRREFGKRLIDSSRLEIAVNHGNITLTGGIYELHGYPDANIPEEITLAEKVISAHPEFRSIFRQYRVFLHKEEKVVHGGNRTGYRRR